MGDEDWDGMDSCWFCRKCDTWHDFADEGCTCDRDARLRAEGAAEERAAIVARLMKEARDDRQTAVWRRAAAMVAAHIEKMPGGDDHG